jgi:adenylate kinase
VKELDVVHLSTGDMLRAAIKAGSEDGRAAEEYVTSGRLVPDDVMIRIVGARVMEPDCLERGFVLDGFPRTAVQADALVAAGVQCDVFLQIELDDEEAIKRVAGRRLDPETGDIYHMKYRPPAEEILDRLVQREDDTEDKVRVRLATYHNNMADIIENFAHCTVSVDSNKKEAHQIWAEFREGLKRYVLLGDPTGA